MVKINYKNIFASTVPDPVAMPGVKKPMPKYPFVMSYPDPASLPIIEAHTSMGEILKEIGTTESVYPDTQGYPPLRQYISERLAQRRNHNVGMEDILLTEGSGQAIHLVTEALVDPGDVVIVDDFVYGGTLWSLRRYQSDIRGVSSDSDGMLPEALDTTIQNAMSEGKRTKFIYMIPTFQNPQAWSMPVYRRKEILSVASKHRIPILEDDGIAEFRFEGKHIPSMASFDDSGIVIHTGTFSKVIVPGMRIGYLIATPQLLETVMAIKGTRGVTQFGALAVYKFATTRLDSHLKQLNTTLKLRRDSMMESLNEFFGNYGKWATPEGGLYTWLTLPEEVDLVKAAPEAEQSGVIYDLGTKFATGSDPGRNKARLCFSFNTEEQIHEGIRLLSLVVRK